MQQMTKHTSVVQQPAAVLPRTIEIGFRFSKDFDGINPPRLVNTVVGTLAGRLNKRPKGTIEVELLSSTSQSEEVKEVIGKRFIDTVIIFCNIIIIVGIAVAVTFIDGICKVHFPYHA